MREAWASIVTAREAERELRWAQRAICLDEMLASLGYTVRDFHVAAWGDELRAWIVSQVALFRAGGYQLYANRDPAAGAMFWMVRFLDRCWPGEVADDFVSGQRSLIVAVAENPQLVFDAEKLARAGDVRRSA